MGLSFEDRALIEERFIRYMWAIDTGDVDTLVECFTEDGALHSPVVGTHRGRAAIRKFAERFAQLPPKGVQLRHAISNMLIEGDGETAEAKCYLTVHLTKDGKSRLLAPGRYECSLRKTGGAWRFTDRLVAMDHDYTIDGL